jgi:hypothetical protein
MSHESPSHDAAYLTHVTRQGALAEAGTARGAPLRSCIGPLRCDLSGMRACADAHGLLRACSEDASGNGSPFCGVESYAVAVLLAGMGDTCPKCESSGEAGTLATCSVDIFVIQKWPFPRRR